MNEPFYKRPDVWIAVVTAGGTAASIYFMVQGKDQVIEFVYKALPPAVAAIVKKVLEAADKLIKNFKSEALGYVGFGATVGGGTLLLMGAVTLNPIILGLGVLSLATGVGSYVASEGYTGEGTSISGKGGTSQEKPPENPSFSDSILEELKDQKLEYQEKPSPDFYAETREKKG